MEKEYSSQNLHQNKQIPKIWTIVNKLTFWIEQMKLERRFENLNNEYKALSTQEKKKKYRRIFVLFNTKREKKC